MRSLNPTADGFAVGGIIVQPIHGDGFRTWETPARSFHGVGTAFAALGLIAKEN